MASSHLATDALSRPLVETVERAAQSVLDTAGEPRAALRQGPDAQPSPTPSILGTGLAEPEGTARPYTSGALRVNGLPEDGPWVQRLALASSVEQWVPRVPLVGTPMLAVEPLLARRAARWAVVHRASRAAPVALRVAHRVALLVARLVARLVAHLHDARESARGCPRSGGRYPGPPGRPRAHHSARTKCQRRPRRPRPRP
jgi:hypothetical protein